MILKQKIRLVKNMGFIMLLERIIEDFKIIRGYEKVSKEHMKVYVIWGRMKNDQDVVCVIVSEEGRETLRCFRGDEVDKADEFLIRRAGISLRKLIA